LYYTRDRMEKIFSLCKKCAKILPISVQSEISANGHILMAFMATAFLQMITEKLKGTKYTQEQAFMILHEQHGIVYDDQIITGEPTHKMNELYKIFGITCPVSIPLPVQGVDVK
ncbi:MAG: hypothetical protein LUD29_06400, partial [Clostridia bacterium]|nr:hypothetical protein [Clostridia bacterium]